LTKQLKITLKRSLIGTTERQRRTAEALGLSKINQFVTQQDTPSIRGMVKKLEHLLDVQEI